MIEIWNPLSSQLDNDINWSYKGIKMIWIEGIPINWFIGIFFISFSVSVATITNLTKYV
jgi:hypothetical protein